MDKKKKDNFSIFYKVNKVQNIHIFFFGREHKSVNFRMGKLLV